MRSTATTPAKRTATFLSIFCLSSFLIGFCCFEKKEGPLKNACVGLRHERSVKRSPCGWREDFSRGEYYGKKWLCEIKQGTIGRGKKNLTAEARRRGEELCFPPMGGCCCSAVLARLRTQPKKNGISLKF